MSTINDSNLINKIISSKGYLEDDPRVYQIVEYITAWNGIAYGVTWFNESEERRCRYEVESDHVRRPQILWRADDERYKTNRG